MKETKFSLKTYIKDLLSSADLYKREQRFIYIVLLCFAVSAVTLPAISERILPDDVPDIPVELPQDTDAETDDDKEDTDSAKDDKEDSKDRDSSKPSKGSSGGSSSAGDSNGSQSTSKPSNSGTTSKPNSSGSSSSGNKDPNAGKTWVPPVYKTVHHEAVYESKTVEMCTEEGCGKYFDTPAEFQAHQASEGG